LPLLLRRYGIKTAAFYPPAVFYVEPEKLKAYADSNFHFEYVKVGGYVESEAFLCGYYVVDVESEERAVELAAKIPDAEYTAVEVRKVVHEG